MCCFYSNNWPRVCLVLSDCWFLREINWSFPLRWGVNLLEYLLQKAFRSYSIHFSWLTCARCCLVENQGIMQDWCSITYIKNLHCSLPYRIMNQRESWMAGHTSGLNCDNLTAYTCPSTFSCLLTLIYIKRLSSPSIAVVFLKHLMEIRFFSALHLEMVYLCTVSSVWKYMKGQLLK